MDLPPLDLSFQIIIKIMTSPAIAIAPITKTTPIAIGTIGGPSTSRV